MSTCAACSAAPRRQRSHHPQDLPRANRAAVISPFARHVACVFTAVLLLGGCTTSAPRKSQTAASSTTDPCAMRLHEFCAPLLLYFATNHSPPPNVEAFKTTPEEFGCPVSPK